MEQDMAVRLETVKARIAECDSMRKRRDKVRSVLSFVLLGILILYAILFFVHFKTYDVDKLVAAVETKSAEVLPEAFGQVSASIGRITPVLAEEFSKQSDKIISRLLDEAEKEFDGLLESFAKYPETELDAVLGPRLQKSRTEIEKLRPDLKDPKKMEEFIGKVKEGLSFMVDDILSKHFEGHLKTFEEIQDTLREFTKKPVDAGTDAAKAGEVSDLLDAFYEVLRFKLASEQAQAGKSAK